MRWNQVNIGVGRHGSNRIWSNGPIAYHIHLLHRERRIQWLLPGPHGRAGLLPDRARRRSLRARVRRALCQVRPRHDPTHQPGAAPGPHAAPAGRRVPARPHDRRINHLWRRLHLRRRRLRRDRIDDLRRRRHQPVLSLRQGYHSGHRQQLELLVRGLHHRHRTVQGRHVHDGHRRRIRWRRGGRVAAAAVAAAHRAHVLRVACHQRHQLPPHAPKHYNPRVEQRVALVARRPRSDRPFLHKRRPGADRDRQLRSPLPLLPLRGHRRPGRRC